LLHQIRDAVVQDANDSEGTGSWANEQAIESHVPAPSLTAAHYLRTASSQIEQRAAVNGSIDNAAPTLLHPTKLERAEILNHLGHTVYLSTLMCFVQGLDVMEREKEKEKWGIIKSDAISEILQTSYTEGPHAHFLCKSQIAEKVKKHRPSLKKVVFQ
jgi:6-phosphogluconate dehydrogenase